jgi:hypothetical protein
VERVSLIASPSWSWRTVRVGESVSRFGARHRRGGRPGVRPAARAHPRHQQAALLGAVRRRARRAQRLPTPCFPHWHRSSRRTVSSARLLPRKGSRHGPLSRTIGWPRRRSRRGSTVLRYSRSSALTTARFPFAPGSPRPARCRFRVSGAAGVAAVETAALLSSGHAARQVPALTACPLYRHSGHAEAVTA